MCLALLQIRGRPEGLYTQIDIFGIPDDTTISMSSQGVAQNHSMPPGLEMLNTAACLGVVEQGASLTRPSDGFPAICVGISLAISGQRPATDWLTFEAPLLVAIF